MRPGWERLDPSGGAERLQPREQRRGRGGGRGATGVCPGMEGCTSILMGGLQQWVNVRKSPVPFSFMAPVFIKATLLWVGQHPWQEQGAITAPHALSKPSRVRSGGAWR